MSQNETAEIYEAMKVPNDFEVKDIEFDNMVAYNANVRKISKSFEEYCANHKQECIACSNFFIVKSGWGETCSQECYNKYYNTNAHYPPMQSQDVQPYEIKAFIEGATNGLCPLSFTEAIDAASKRYAISHGKILEFLQPATGELKRYLQNLEEMGN